MIHDRASRHGSTAGPAIHCLTMKVLALGNSDSRGDRITGRTWSDIARHDLGARLASPLVFENIPYSVIGPTAVAYAERKLAEAEPDVVVLPLGSYLFTAGFTWVRVQRLFGQRAGRWYRRIEERFDRETRERGSVGDGVNRFARVVLRRVVGTQPMATREQVVAAYGDLFRTLSRREEMSVVIVTYPGRGEHARSKRAIRERALFFPEVEALARRHHFGWVDGERAFAAAPPGEVIHRVDGLHFNDYGHELLGKAVVAAILDSRAVTDERMSTS